MDSGVYRITNTVTGDFYIGSSSDLVERFQRHRRDLFNGKHHSRFMMRSWLKYGKEVFEFRVLETCDPVLLMERENFYLRRDKPTFNSCPMAYSSLGRRMDKEEKQRRSRYALTHGVRPPACTYEAKRRPVCAFKKTGEMIKEFESLTAACLFIGRTHRFASTIASCCNGGRHKTFGGYVWKWAARIALQAA